MEQKSIRYQHADIHYKIYGKGFPVLLIHGFAEDSNIWNNQVQSLKDRYQLIVPDLPGSGISALISKEHIGIEEYAEAIRQILLQEKIEKLIMIGHSMGGYITLAFAEKYPELLSAFGLFHSSAYADDDAKIETRKKAIGFIRKNGAEAFLKTSIPGLFYEQQENSLEVQQHLKQLEDARLAHPFSAEALIQYYEAMIARPNRTILLRETPLPVMFILGEHDKAVPFKHGLEQTHLPQHTYINILRNSAHMGMLEETAKSNEILGNFLLNHSF